MNSAEKLRFERDKYISALNVRTLKVNQKLIDAYYTKLARAWVKRFQNKP